MPATDTSTTQTAPSFNNGEPLGSGGGSLFDRVNDFIRDRIPNSRTDARQNAKGMNDASHLTAQETRDMLEGNGFNIGKLKRGMGLGYSDQALYNLVDKAAAFGAEGVDKNSDQYKAFVNRAKKQYSARTSDRTLGGIVAGGLAGAIVGAVTVPLAIAASIIPGVKMKSTLGWALKITAAATALVGAWGATRGGASENTVGKILELAYDRGQQKAERLNGMQTQAQTQEPAQQQHADIQPSGQTAPAQASPVVAAAPAPNPAAETGLPAAAQEKAAATVKENPTIRQYNNSTPARTGGETPDELEKQAAEFARGFTSNPAVQKLEQQIAPRPASAARPEGVNSLDELSKEDFLKFLNAQRKNDGLSEIGSDGKVLPNSIPAVKVNHPENPLPTPPVASPSGANVNITKN
jgi:hypothetical protein